MIITNAEPSIEDVALTTDAVAVATPSPAKFTGARRFILRVQGIAFLLGALLLIYVIHLIGVQPIFDALRSIGLGFFILLGLSGVRHVFRTLAMSTAIPPEHRRFNFGQAFAARLGGEAISFLTFTGPLLGEATKAALLRRRVPLAHGLPALVIDNLIYNLSVAIFVGSGACVLLASYNLPTAVRFALVGIACSAGGGLLAFALAARSRVMPFTWLLDGLIHLNLQRDLFVAKREHIRQLESDVYRFYGERPRSFLAMVGFNFLAHAASVTEVYLALRMLGSAPQLQGPTSLVQAAYVIESLTKVINFAFGFVPATIGVYEGGTEVILQVLGFAAATGITLALVRKAGIVFWTVLGLIVLAWRAVPGAARRVIDRHPRLHQLMDNLVFSNISHRPARTLVTIIGVGIGVLLILLTVGLAHGVLRERGRREAHIGAEIMVRASGTFGLGGSQPFTLPVSRAEEIARLPGVRAAVPLGQHTVNSDSGFGVRVLEGVAFAQYQALAVLRIVEGRGLNESGDEAIVDTVWKEQRGAKVGDQIQLYDRPYRIVGVYDPPGGSRIKIPLATMQEQLDGEGRATSVLVACVSPAEQEAVAERISALFPDDQLIFTRDLPELYAASVPALSVFISVVVTIAAAISTLVILLAMYTTVTERTRQIGILKSLGMSRAKIAWVIEQEALLVSVLGVITGFLLALAARFAIMRATSLTIDIEPRWVGIALLIGVLGGTIGALYPALRAARQDAVEALSYE
ncbi:MAG: ABC transporter permease [Pyrinomonadaceae bacterium]|nr:ABC transporter permease [Pyrinomonadaceae bacterium]